MNRKLPLSIISAILAAVLWSCNSDEDPDSEQEMVYPASTAISSFSLVKDNDVLANLDSVFFTIDLTTASIFNADSLPYGTDVSKLIVKIGASASAIELTMPGVTVADTTVNYLTNSTDSINFSRGSVSLKVVALDGQSDRTYEVKVNVHQVEPDSLYWSESAHTTLPSALTGTITAQKAVEFNGKVLCLTTDGTDYCLASTDNPYDGNWSTASIAMPATMKVNSLAATDNELYILDADNNLYSSADAGTTWTDCHATMTHIYGGFAGRLLGVTEAGDGSYLFTSYPDGYTAPIADDFPIAGTSQLITYTNAWESSPQAVMAGGFKADGTASDGTWGFDGNDWVQFSVRGSMLPAASGMTLFPYFAFHINTNNWKINKMSAWFAMGGVDESGEMQPDVYVSLDNGIHWRKGGDLVQLPEYIPTFSGAQAIVVNHTVKSRGGIGSWTEMPVRKLPHWWQTATTCPTPDSRATAPITEWECPYIYLFGGVDSRGNLYDSLWRGLINRLESKPIQ